MKNSFKNLGLSKVANKYVDRMDQMEKLKEIANRKNYPHKLKKLAVRIQEEFDFWNIKEPSRKLEDITKDLIFIKSVKEPTLNKERIDILAEKYGIK